ncbi:MAG: tRNA pseudouridine(55) synthase TruB [Micrococcales bacterium]
MPSGLALIDKPAGWTSHDVVAKLRGIAGTRKVGHAGTLDPMATGLLVIGIDDGTKLLTFIVGQDKTYEATIRLGAATITDDAEGDYTEFGSLSGCSEERIREEIAKLTGEILQVPSSVSAIKVDGKRAYAAVRSGDEVKLQARPVTVSEFAIVSEARLATVDGHEYLDIDARISCSSGTYIRALARDLGAALGSFGHLTALRRTRIGAYQVSDAQELEGLTRESLKITSMFESIAGFEIRELSEQDEIDLVHGKRIVAGAISQGDTHAIAGVRDGRVVAMLERRGQQLKSLVVWPKGDK